ncbi:conjugal transfer protein TraF [Shewanella fidelis]|uniref:Conjugal transfer protein TraF n=1 Tax=Shewanella fidelis TaxID=173509 RepID=A0AAW8NQR0_9GAMM|nr:conjugal transfer protein TraF [Shewanella fidelis]MDR8525247.1 conjugal transfer protein TraF [Shewanella fidelis]MDW4811318.1 conjugal transfer protein TraF [Shewanella fidelis]MDW4814903.1 conjugal transfer protein TraF [Shewanella fidelis]MDW4818993.1 conjugal transfer protein TraF [Shewanella fidelis]MDW4823330.1 conjugal transfer protein TraF [Shewanella fidelis]
MNGFKIALACILIPCFSAQAAQGSNLVYRYSVGGVAAAYIEGSAFVNPALLALSPQKNRSLEQTNIQRPDNHFPVSFDKNLLGQITPIQPVASLIGETHSKTESDLANSISLSLNQVSGRKTTANLTRFNNVSAIADLNLAIASFYREETDVFTVTDNAGSMSSRANKTSLNNIELAYTDMNDVSPVMPAVASRVADTGITLSLPLSIVNMPIAVGLSTKLQKIETYNYIANSNPFDNQDSNLGGFSDMYRNDETHFNVDLGLAMQPITGLTLEVSGRNLIGKQLNVSELDWQPLSYQIQPLVKAGVTYDWQYLSLSTDIDLVEHKQFEQLDSTQFWRVDGEVRAFDWMSVRLGVRHDIKQQTTNIYSLGSGFSFGESFFLDFTGTYSKGNAVGGVLRTSYHF